MYMYYVNPNIENLYRTSYDESRKNFIRLDMNENPEGLPKSFFNEVISSITPEDIAMYPETNSLVEKLAVYLNSSNSNIFLTNGSDDAIRLLFEVFGETGKKVVSATPSFEMYSVYIKMYGMVHAPITFNRNFDINLNDILTTIDGDTGIVVILNPNSPIGRTWTESEVREIIKKANENGALVVLDEAYFYFSSNTYLNLFREFDNLMIFRTFSKMLSIAGCRIGYVVSNERIISLLKKASSTYQINYFAIKFAEKLIERPDVIEHLINTELMGRKYLLSQLQKAKYEYHYNNGNYILIKSKRDPKEIFNKLKNKNILVKTYNTPILSDWVRVTTGSMEIMRTFWEQFEKIDQ